jgi:hypothetical protein
LPLLLVAAMLGSGHASGQDLILPQSIGVREQVLALAAAGARPEGPAERYHLGVYLPAHAPLAHVWRLDIPKSFVLRLGPTGVDWPVLPGEWMHNLLPPLTPDGWQLLSERVAAMEEGDVMRVDYMPQAGTVVSVEDEAVLSDPGHDVFEGFARTWLGDTPVSDALKQDLIDSAAAAGR